MANIPVNRTLETSPTEHLEDHRQLHERHNLYDAKGDLIVGAGDDDAIRLAIGPTGYVLMADDSVGHGMRWVIDPALQLLDAKGDLIVATGDNVAIRLPRGADGDMLTADSAVPAGLKWQSKSGETLAYQGTWVAQTGGGETLYTFSDGLVPAEFVSSPAGAATIQADAATNTTYTHALQTPQVGNGQNGWTELVVNVPTGETATIDFHRRIESEGCCDPGYFNINGVQQYSERGFTGWGYKGPYTLQAGQNVLRWGMSHDGSVLSGFNAQRITGVRLPTPIVGRSYLANDVVKHNGRLWIALRASTNVEPVEGPDWTLFGFLTSGLLMMDEGTALTGRATVDFVGPGVTATDDAVGDKTVITVPGAGGAVRSEAADATAANGEVLFVDATTVPITVTLPAPTSGHTVRVKKTDATANAVTVAGAGTDVIDDEATFTLANQYDAIQVVGDGTKWWVV